MQKKQLSVLVLIILCFLLGCNRETPKDESQQNYEDESNISKTNGEELVNINSELLGSTPFDIQIDKTALQTRKETETEVTIKTNLTDWGYTVSSEKAANLPQQMIENIAKGRLGKFLKEVCLLNQEDIMDAKKTVREVLKDADPELKIVDFKRFTLKAE